jgi:hypothetical protein
MGTDEVRIITPEQFAKSVEELFEKFQDEPELLRGWTEVLMSNTLHRLGYDQSKYTDMALRYGWLWPKGEDKPSTALLKKVDDD